jgi:hypothetical protein
MCCDINLHSVPEAWTYVQFSNIFLANLSADSEHESFSLFFTVICMFSSTELANQHKPAVGVYRSISNNPRKLELSELHMLMQSLKATATKRLCYRSNYVFFCPVNFLYIEDLWGL